MSGWERLSVECSAMEAWYSGSLGVSVWVCTDSRGSFEGGAHVDADPLSEDEWGETPLRAFGDTFEECADDLIRRLRQYREDRDREKAELLAEYAEEPRDA